MKTIYSFLGKIPIIVDDNLFDYLSTFRWNVSNGYAVTRNRRKKKPFPKIKQLDIYMHRLVFDKYKNKIFYVDHINSNKLDNRMCNLRYATNQQNQANSKISSNNKSGYKGVSWDKVNKKWVAQVMLNHKNIKLGRFSKKEDAYLVYCNAGEKLFGNYFRKK